MEAWVRSQQPLHGSLAGVTSAGVLHSSPGGRPTVAYTGTSSPSVGRRTLFSIPDAGLPPGAMPPPSPPLPGAWVTRARLACVRTAESASFTCRRLSRCQRVPRPWRPCVTHQCVEPSSGSGSRSLSIPVHTHQLVPTSDPATGFPCPAAADGYPGRVPECDSGRASLFTCTGVQHRCPK